MILRNYLKYVLFLYFIIFNSIPGLCSAYKAGKEVMPESEKGLLRSSKSFNVDNKYIESFEETLFNLASKYALTKGHELKYVYLKEGIALTRTKRKEVLNHPVHTIKHFKAAFNGGITYTSRDIETPEEEDKPVEMHRDTAVLTLREANVRMVPLTPECKNDEWMDVNLEKHVVNYAWYENRHSRLPTTCTYKLRGIKTETLAEDKTRELSYNLGLSALLGYQGSGGSIGASRDGRHTHKREKSMQDAQADERVVHINIPEKTAVKVRDITETHNYVIPYLREILVEGQVVLGVEVGSSLSPEFNRFGEKLISIGELFEFGLVGNYLSTALLSDPEQFKEDLDFWFKKLVPRWRIEYNEEYYPNLRKYSTSKLAIFTEIGYLNTLSTTHTVDVVEILENKKLPLRSTPLVSVAQEEYSSTSPFPPSLSNLRYLDTCIKYQGKNARAINNTLTPTSKNNLAQSSASVNNGTVGKVSSSQSKVSYSPLESLISAFSAGSFPEEMKDEKYQSLKGQMENIDERIAAHREELREKNPFATEEELNNHVEALLEEKDEILMQINIYCLNKIKEKRSSYKGGLETNQGINSSQSTNEGKEEKGKGRVGHLSQEQNKKEKKGNKKKGNKKKGSKMALLEENNREEGRLANEEISLGSNNSKDRETPKKPILERLGIKDKEEYLKKHPEKRNLYELLCGHRIGEGYVPTVEDRAKAERTPVSISLKNFKRVEGTAHLWQLKSNSEQ